MLQSLKLPLTLVSAQGWHGPDGACGVRGRTRGVDVRRCFQQRVGVLLYVTSHSPRNDHVFFSRCVSASASVQSLASTHRYLTLPSPFPASSSAPAFQLTRYYRYGELDTCEGRWRAIWACMDRSKRYVKL